MRESHHAPWSPARPALFAAILVAAAAAFAARPLARAQEERNPGEHFVAPAINMGTAGPTTVDRAYDLRYAQRTPQPEGGEQIVLATDRYIRFWEAAGSSRTTDYPFTIIEMRLDRDGRGKGKMFIATRVIGDKRNHTIVLENWGTQPVMLKDVRRERS